MTRLDTALSARWHTQPPFAGTWVVSSHIFGGPPPTFPMLHCTGGFEPGEVISCPEQPFHWVAAFGTTANAASADGILTAACARECCNPPCWDESDQLFQLAGGPPGYSEGSAMLIVDGHADAGPGTGVIP